VPLESWPAAARSGVAGTARMPPGSATLVLVRALAWRGLVGGVARWHGTTRADRSAGSHGLPRHALAGKAGVTGRADVARPRGLARRHRVARPRRLAGSHVVTGRHGRRRLAAGGIRRPAGTARIHAGLVTGTRRLDASPAGRRPVLVPPAGRRSRRRCSRGWRSRGWRRSGGPQDFRDELASWRPRRATIPGHVEQAARCVHIRRVQHGRPTGARSAVTAACARGTSAEPVLAVPLRWARPRRLAAPGGSRRWLRAAGPPPMIRRTRRRPGPSSRTDPRDGENHQDHQTERDARGDRVQPKPDHIDRVIAGQKPHDHARGHQDDAEHDRHGSRDRQDDDEAHPPGSGGIRAHCSTIASRLPARKPYGQL
jgi:hypothetical protein